MGQKRKRAAGPPTRTDAPSATVQTKSKKPKRKSAEQEGGNVPRKFRMLMAHKDLSQKTKEIEREQNAWKRTAQQSEATEAEATKKLVPEPGEKLSDFNRRVDSIMPIKHSKSSETKGPADIIDFAEKRRRKQSERQKKQNEEHLNRLRKKDEARQDDTDKAFDDYEFATFNKEAQTGKGRKRAASPDPWAVLLRPERQYKFNDTVEAPPILTKKGKLVKGAPRV
ncbi:hypothetical protein BCR37DRAFT_376759 [Protomyces lactucae-debilis]|uniref:Uncharacterized protein n=1 Tax=Protomyces lactucae-debilis TaxID=2754530 RepID=A0A1Y2FQE5_PROLT|nr:uncharacterized protein BCR37DRAFT_376759 [Protomyces lactucae-debilis]ORY86213.1 hypothetical protein BCR37DRAFT_376759 [Protomyces lactucae-debilis]